MPLNWSEILGFGDSVQANSGLLEGHTLESLGGGFANTASATFPCPEGTAGGCASRVLHVWRCTDLVRGRITGPA